MPNEVYVRTRAGLSTLVSPRAATRMLDDALRRSGMSAEKLAPDAVHDLLMGPVRVELEGILPHNGLRRTLRRLARKVRAETRAAAPRRRPTLFGGGRGTAKPTSAALPASDTGEAPRVVRSSVQLPVAVDLEAVATPSGLGVARDLGPPNAAPRLDPSPAASPSTYASTAALVRESTTAPFVREKQHHPTMVPGHPGPATIAPKLDEKALERVALGYAALDGVVQVAAVRARGEIAFSRGVGADTVALAPLLRTSLLLLSRHGRLRSLVLEHAAGLLFVFPLRSDTIVVLTRPTINIGAVFAARTAIEEGL